MPTRFMRSHTPALVSVPAATTVATNAAAAAGLAHLSEVSDEFVKDLAQLFVEGQRESVSMSQRCRRPCIEFS